MKKHILLLIIVIFVISCCSTQKAPEKKNGGHNESSSAKMAESESDRFDGIYYSETEPTCGGNPIEGPSAPIPTVVPDLPYPAMAGEESSSEMSPRGSEIKIYTPYEAELIARGTLGVIKYNVPKRMELEETKVLHLLIGLDIILNELYPEGPGEIVESNLQISNRMRADLKAVDPEAFEIKRHREEPDRLLTEGSAEWFWDITAKKNGPQQLELKVYRLIKFENVEDWKRIESYKDTITINATIFQKLEKLVDDWKWIAALVGAITTIFGWIKLRKKKKVKNG